MICWLATVALGACKPHMQKTSAGISGARRISLRCKLVFASPKHSLGHCHAKNDDC